MDPNALEHWLMGDSVDIAPQLLGSQLSCVGELGVVSVLLTEVEAYAGPVDPASHAFRGRTARNEVMFGPAGHLYVYRSHGLHWCANIVTGPPGVASAVLLRAGRVIQGLGIARERRGGRADPMLARGPGCFTSALGIVGEDGGANLLGRGRIRLVPKPAGSSVVTGPRVGVSQAADRPWRFWLKGEPSVSAYRRSPRAR